MNPATSSSRYALLIALGVLCLGSSPSLSGAFAAEAAPDNENGRYTFSPSPDGLVRLDTRTGTVSTCNNTAAGWACYAVPDERMALDQEIGRLQAENAKLKAQLASRDAAAPGAPDEKQAESQRRIEIPLPSDQDMDRVMSFLQRAWKRLVEMANQVQKDVSGDGKI